LAGCGLIQALFFSGDFPGMPYIVIPALLGLVAGLLLIGIFILRSDVLPPMARDLLYGQFRRPCGGQ
jgi:hypothetical protein